MATELMRLQPARDVIIDINWDLMLEQRQAVLAHSEVPPYLILPEVHRLLQACKHDNTYLMINTLWHTGARISECLSLTPAHFVFNAQQPYVSIQTLKTRGRPKKGQRDKPRLVPITDADYISQVQRYIKSNRVRKDQLLFSISRYGTNKRLDRLVASMPDHDKPSIRVTPHTLRHSFAINIVLQGIPHLQILQQWMGHTDINSTLIYTQVLALETHHFMQRIRY